MRNPLRIEVPRGIYGNLNDGFSIATFDYRMVFCMWMMVDAGGRTYSDRSELAPDQKPNWIYRYMPDPGSIWSGNGSKIMKTWQDMASKHCTNTKIRRYHTSAEISHLIIHLICNQGALNANRKLDHSSTAWMIHVIHDWNRAVAWWVESHGLSKEVFHTFRAFQTRSRVLAFFWVALCSPWFHVLTETA